MRWLAFFALLGCGDNLPGVTLDERQEAEAAARCVQLTRCGLFANEDTCVAFGRPPDERALRAAIDAGITHYSPSTEAICLHDLAAKSCDRTARDNRSVPLSCQGALLGTRAPGGECALDEECSSGRCDTPVCEPTECCVGTCRALKQALGGECYRSDDCSDGTVCLDGHCATLLESGAKCAMDSECEFGLACVSETCRALPATGQPCPYDRCADLGARCVSGTCEPVGLPGTDCASDADCSLYAQCNETTGSCEEVPTLGMSCDGRCAGGSRCAGGVCGPPLDDGEPCTGYSECASQLCAEGPIFDVCVTGPVCY
jgi:hypothetical protein